MNTPGTVAHGPIKGIGGQKKDESHDAAQMALDPSHRKGLGWYIAGRAEGKLVPVRGFSAK